MLSDLIEDQVWEIEKKVDEKELNRVTVFLMIIVLWLGLRIHKF